MAYRSNLITGEQEAMEIIFTGPEASFLLNDYFPSLQHLPIHTYQFINNHSS